MTVLGCRAMKKNKTEFSDVRTGAEVSLIDTASVKVQEIEKKEAVSTSVKKNETEQKGSVEIVGKTDSANSFSYENIVGNDTLKISITGNADFTIKNNFSNKVKESAEETVKETLNIVQEIARKSVAKETIEKVATEIKATEKKVAEKGFTFGAWFTGLLVLIILICAIWLFVYFGGKINWKNLIQKFKK